MSVKIKRPKEIEPTKTFCNLNVGEVFRYNCKKSDAKSYYMKIIDVYYYDNNRQSDCPGITPTPSTANAINIINGAFLKFDSEDEVVVVDLEVRELDNK